MFKYFYHCNDKNWQDFSEADFLAKILRFLKSSLEFWLHIQFRIALILSTTFLPKSVKSIVDIVEHGHFVGLQKKKANNSDSIRLLFGFSHRKAIFDVNEVQLFKFLLIDRNSNGFAAIMDSLQRNFIYEIVTQNCPKSQHY